MSPLSGITGTGELRRRRLPGKARCFVAINFFPMQKCDSGCRTGTGCGKGLIHKSTLPWRWPGTLPMAVVLPGGLRHGQALGGAACECPEATARGRELLHVQACVHACIHAYAPIAFLKKKKKKARFSKQGWIFAPSAKRDLPSSSLLGHVPVPQGRGKDATRLALRVPRQTPWCCPKRWTQGMLKLCGCSMGSAHVYNHEFLWIRPVAQGTTPNTASLPISYIITYIPIYFH